MQLKDFDVREGFNNEVLIFERSHAFLLIVYSKTPRRNNQVALLVFSELMKIEADTVHPNAQEGRLTSRIHNSGMYS